MLFTLNEIHDYRLRATHGDFGEIKAFLVDSDAWTLRYLVIEVDSRQVLLSVVAVGSPLPSERVFPVNISKEKILNSPTFDLNQPVSREVESRYSDYFEWPYYWEPDEVPNSLPGDLTAVPLIDMELDREQKIEEQELIPETGAANQPADTNLHSTKALFGRSIFTINDDRNAGKLVDLVTRNEDWNILYMVIDTGGLLSGKKVLIAPTWVERIDRTGLHVNLKQESIHDIPEFQSMQDLTRDYQDRLNDYFNR